MRRSHFGIRDASFLQATILPPYHT
jgi:hypothetical protein